jgi:hypothetical protein
MTKPTNATAHKPYVECLLYIDDIFLRYDLRVMALSRIQCCKVVTKHTQTLKFRVFWDVTPCSHVEVERSFRRAYCLHHQGDDGGSTHL